MEVTPEQAEIFYRRMRRLSPRALRGFIDELAGHQSKAIREFALIADDHFFGDQNKYEEAQKNEAE